MNALEILRQIRSGVPVRLILSDQRCGSLEIIDRFDEARLETRAKAEVRRSTSCATAGQIIRTENQCGQCLAWRLSVLVELGRGQGTYLCPGCLERHRSGTT